MQAQFNIGITEKKAKMSKYSQDDFNLGLTEDEAVNVALKVDFIKKKLDELMHGLIGTRIFAEQDEQRRQWDER